MDIDNQHEYWNSVAEAKNFTHRLNQKLLERYFSKNDLIIDYGCGYGRIVSMLINFGYSRVKGYDTSVKLVERGVRKEQPGGMLYISDYYLQENTGETGKYETLNDDPQNFGVFLLAEGVTFRHHTRDWIDALLKEFNIIYNEEVIVKTMNGHVATAFQILAHKR